MRVSRPPRTNTQPKSEPHHACRKSHFKPPNSWPMSERLRGFTLFHNFIRQGSTRYLHVQWHAILAIQKGRTHVCHEQAVASLKPP